MLTAVVLDVDHEGFGRAVVMSGRLVLLAESLRDAGRFGFAGLEPLAAAGERLVKRAAAVVGRYPGVAHAED